MKIYVGNLSWNTTTQDLRDHFQTFGNVSDAIVLSDRDTGRSRGFGFVTMDDDSEGNAAIEGSDGKDMDGRALRVNVAREREPR